MNKIFDSRSVFLFRHGDKQMSSGNNPGLSKSGKSQALQLKNFCIEGRIPAPTAIWISPKLRTLESMQPTAQHFQLNCQVIPELSERHREERQNHFEARIQKVLQQAIQDKGVLFICSHYDWLEESLPLIPSSPDEPSITSFSWHPLSYLGFEIIEGLWHLNTKGHLLP